VLATQVGGIQLIIPTQGCICEILTGGSEFGTHTDQTGKVFDARWGMLRHIEEYQVKFVAVTTEYTAV